MSSRGLIIPPIHLNPPKHSSINCILGFDSKRELRLPNTTYPSILNLESIEIAAFFLTFFLLYQVKNKWSEESSAVSCDVDDTSPLST